MFTRGTFSMLVAAIFFLVALLVLGRTGETVAKVLVDTTLPAGSPFPAGFIHFATEEDWGNVVEAVILCIAGIALAIAVQKTKWV